MTGVSPEIRTAARLRRARSAGSQPGDGHNGVSAFAARTLRIRPESKAAVVPKARIASSPFSSKGELSVPAGKVSGGLGAGCYHRLKVMREVVGHREEEDELVRLMVAYQAGELAAFELLYGRLAAELRRYFQAVAEGVGQDLVQET